MICSFSGKYHWLSNFAPVEIQYQGIVYPSVEHAYVAAKTTDIDTRKYIASLSSAGEAKKYGRALKLPPNWEKDKLSLMRQLCELKFKQPKYKELLLATQDIPLLEGNTWGDMFWGIVPQSDGSLSGFNNLGEILMKIREDLLNHEYCSGNICEACYGTDIITVGANPDGFNMNIAYDCNSCGNTWEGY